VSLSQDSTACLLETGYVDPASAPEVRSIFLLDGAELVLRAIEGCQVLSVPPVVDIGEELLLLESDGIHI